MKGTKEVGIICDETRLVLCEKEEVRMRCKDCLSTLLASDQNNLAQVPECMEETTEVDQASECTVEISMEEARECIGGLKGRKAAEVCGIVGEMLEM